MLMVISLFRFFVGLLEFQAPAFEAHVDRYNKDTNTIDFLSRCFFHPGSSAALPIWRILLVKYVNLIDDDINDGDDGKASKRCFPMTNIFSLTFLMKP